MRCNVESLTLFSAAFVVILAILHVSNFDMKERERTGDHSFNMQRETYTSAYIENHPHFL